MRALRGCGAVSAWPFFAFLAFLFGIIFLTAFSVFLTADFAALTTRLVTDFAFDFLVGLTLCRSLLVYLEQRTSTDRAPLVRFVPVATCCGLRGSSMPPVIRQKTREQTRTNVNDLDREPLILLEFPARVLRS